MLKKEYIYFNELIGGFKNAYGDYESDYYFNSLKATADYLKKDTEIKPLPLHITMYYIICYIKK